MENTFHAPTLNSVELARRAFARHKQLHTFAHYTGILALQGLSRLAVQMNDAELIQTCRTHFEPFVSGNVQFKCNFPNYLCGGNGAAFLLWKGHLPEASEPVRRYAEQIMHEAPRDAGGLVKMPGHQADLIWIDAAFAVTPFLLFAGLAFENDAYVNEAVKQTTGLCDTLLDPTTGLLHQSRGFAGEGKLSQDHWSRGNGWGLLALAELAAWLPDAHPHRAGVEKRLTDLLNAALK